MLVNRRQALAVAAGGIAFAAVGPNINIANAATADEVIGKFTGGATPSEGGVKLGTPEIAENGNTVPITLSVDSPMTEDDHVKSVLVVADGNPNAEVVIFNFSLASGVAAAKTRIRLAKTQNVIAVAKMGDGSFKMAKNQVKVTIGGCGG